MPQLQPGLNNLPRLSLFVPERQAGDSPIRHAATSCYIADAGQCFPISTSGVHSVIGGLAIREWRPAGGKPAHHGANGWKRTGRGGVVALPA